MRQEDWLLLLLVPAGVVLLYMADRQDHHSDNPVTRSVEKEGEFIGFNKNAIFINLLHAEEHLHNIADSTVAVDKGEASCIVKHLATAEGHADEAISHAADLGRAGKKHGTPAQYKKIRDELHDLREDFTEGKFTPEETISNLRDLRREFEGFNPEIDITKCKACRIHE